VTYVIAEPCIDVVDRACVDECPVDCIYEGKRSLYIHPDECIDCGACEPVCPVQAIFYQDDLPSNWSDHLADNARFFETPLRGRNLPLGSPGGAAKTGPTGIDTPEGTDGMRVLVDRLAPCGVTCERAQVELWLKVVASVPELRGVVSVGRHQNQPRTGTPTAQEGM